MISVVVMDREALLECQREGIAIAKAKITEYIDGSGDYITNVYFPLNKEAPI